MLILLSNDDGVASDGLHALREAFSETDDVWVVAPDSERTAVAHAITLHEPLRINDLGNHIFSTNGTPADAVLLGLRVVLPRAPDLVISGINKGPNMGQDVSYSGTVAAAKEAAFAKVPALAVSLNGRCDYLFRDATRWVVKVVDRLRSERLPPETVLNINIPNIPYQAVKGFMVTRLGKRIYNGNIIERKDPRGGAYYWFGGDDGGFESIEGTDLHAVHAGFCSLSPLHWDLTRFEIMEECRQMFQEGIEGRLVD